MDVLSLVVGLVSIVVGVIAIALSIRYAGEARTLSAGANATLDVVQDTTSHVHGGVAQLQADLGILLGIVTDGRPADHHGPDSSDPPRQADDVEAARPTSVRDILMSDPNRWFTVVDVVRSGTTGESWPDRLAEIRDLIASGSIECDGPLRARSLIRLTPTAVA